jgi:cytoskeletal protein CcmA (bactofilin family)
VLVVGEGAEISAEIEVGVIIIQGNVTGNIRAKKACELHAPARVKGNIETPSLYIDKGVMFEGHCKMENLGGPMRPTTLDGLAAAAGAKPGAAAPAASAAPPIKK